MECIAIASATAPAFAVGNELSPEGDCKATAEQFGKVN